MYFWLLLQIYPSDLRPVLWSRVTYVYGQSDADPRMSLETFNECYWEQWISNMKEDKDRNTHIR